MRQLALQIPDKINAWDKGKRKGGGGREKGTSEGRREGVAMPLLLAECFGKRDMFRMSSHVYCAQTLTTETLSR